MGKGARGDSIGVLNLNILNCIVGYGGIAKKFELWRFTRGFDFKKNPLLFTFVCWKCVDFDIFSASFFQNSYVGIVNNLDFTIAYQAIKLKYPPAKISKFL